MDGWMDGDDRRKMVGRQGRAGQRYFVISLPFLSCNPVYH